MGPGPVPGKGDGLQGSTINARIETVATKPAFRSAFEKRRCLIPMAVYYEWSVNAEESAKDPWFIHETGPLCAADLWEDNSPLLAPDNLGTFAAITGDSSSAPPDIHNSMPVCLDPSRISGWIAASPDDAMAMLLASDPPAMGPTALAASLTRHAVVLKTYSFQWCNSIASDYPKRALGKPSAAFGSGRRHTRLLQPDVA